MIRSVTEYKTMGDLMGAVKQALRRFTLQKTCLINIENIYSENEVVEQNLMFTDGRVGIRITEISSSDMIKLKTVFNEIAIPYVYTQNKWVSVLRDPDYTDCVIDQLTKLFE